MPTVPVPHTGASSVQSYCTSTSIPVGSFTGTVPYRTVPPVLSHSKYRTGTYRYWYGIIPMYSTVLCTYRYHCYTGRSRSTGVLLVPVTGTINTCIVPVVVLVTVPLRIVSSIRISIALLGVKNITCVLVLWYSYQLFDKLA
jgi:hypothetical protein